MSLDAFCVGIESSIIGFSSIIFPLFIVSFQVLFLSIGKYIGNKLSSTSRIPDKVWSIIFYCTSDGYNFIFTNNL